MPVLKCNACGEYPPIKSNLGMVSETKRLTSYLHPKVCCPDPECKNHTVAVGTKRAYQAHGKSRSGSPRYKCNECGGTFSITPRDARITLTDKDILIFQMLVNKVPLNRIVHMTQISWSVLYKRIDFIYEQCRAFAGSKEKELANKIKSSLYVSVDRQDHIINWSERSDKRNIVLSAIASADNDSGYVFGVNPNFDESADRETIEKESLSSGDLLLKSPYRKHGHYWLKTDYEEAIVTGKARRKKVLVDELEDKIDETYHDLSNRPDVEASDTQTKQTQLPNYGMQVHSEYTMTAHFFLLKDLMKKVQKWRFSLDQDSGIRSAVLFAFQEEVRNKLCEAFYVKINKGLTVDDKRRAKRKAEDKFNELKSIHPDDEWWEIKIRMILEEMENAKKFGDWKDRWIRHPDPNMSEPEKAVCWLTENESITKEHAAALYGKASLHAVDVFFEKVRRRVSLFERAMHSSSTSGRVYSGYACYNPAQVGKLLEILRIVHNFVDVRKTRVEKQDENDIPMVVTHKDTPAMRIGLEDKIYSYEDVLRFDD